MSKFEVPVVLIDKIEPIEGADKIELAKIADYRAVIPKGKYKAGETVIYIPEGSILPLKLVSELGLDGRLTGAKKNRVKAIKLRGCISQGLVMDAHPRMPVGANIAKTLGIKKYEPRIPVQMMGELIDIGSPNTINYDIENLKKYPNLVSEDEEVQVTEKIHGTLIQIGYVPGLNNPDLFFDGNLFVASKGLGARGLVFKNSERNSDNIYVKALRRLLETNDTFVHALETLKANNPDRGVYFLGELYGKGIQDLNYGEEEHQIRVFDIADENKRYVAAEHKSALIMSFGLEQVDILYQGKFNRKKIDLLCQGNTITGKQENILEGLVITPMQEKRSDLIGRVILKHISEEYLLRKGGSEYS